ncbi:MAG: 50S ribosomal protein L9 [Planctomycetota bacterium]
MAGPHRGVHVLLIQDQPPLGQLGDVVEVRPGYARNFLIPSGVACPVTPEALRRIEKHKAEASALRARRAAQLREVAGALEGLNLTIEERASEEGHLFGSVGAREIVAVLEQHGIAVEERQVRLERAIKELGIFSIPIQLDAESEAQIRVWVVEPEEA